MENTLEIYGQKYDPAFPVICFNEHPYQLTKDIVTPAKTEPVERKMKIMTTRGKQHIHCLNDY